ncbi:MAG TPA: nodulation protein NfeD [Anaerolinea sp.]|nr:nodulation protein NfeD [Anaerolinea sp.]
MPRQTLMRWLTLIILAAGLLFPARAALSQSAVPPVVVMRLSGPVNPIWQETIKRALQMAELRGAGAVIIELDTPGGSINTMTALVQQMRASPVPLIVYVTPAGAMAASAGTLITLAGHAAGKAPETTIGAASPVGGQGEDIATTEATKVKEVMKATVRGLAAGRGQQAVTLAESMIDDARAVSAQEALQAGLVDAIAPNLTDLLVQMDGRSVTVAGSPVILKTAGAEVIEVPTTFLEQFLQMLTDPNLVFLLLSVGVQALLIELSSPGGWVAGFIGVVCIALAVFGLGVLPVNWFGIIFLVISFVLFILDIKAPTHGALTVAGMASFIVGALVLFNSPNVPGFPRVSVPLVVGTGVVFGLAFTTILTFALRAQRMPVRIGQESLVRQTGIARSELNPSGSVQLGGELWTATLESGGKIPKGSRVAVVRVEGIQLVVRKVE